MQSGKVTATFNFAMVSVLPYLENTCTGLVSCVKLYCEVPTIEYVPLAVKHGRPSHAMKTLLTQERRGSYDI